LHFNINDVKWVV